VIEGSNISKLMQVIKKIGFNEFDRLELATVASPPPALRIRIDHNTLELDASDVVVAEHLTEHARTVTLSSGSDPSSSILVEKGLLTIQSPLKAGDRVIIASANGGQTYVILDKAVTYSGS